MAEGNPTPIDLLLFHRLERDLFTHLVHQLGRSPERMKWVLSLWLWFEAIGHHDFIRHVAAYGDETVLRFVAEGEACLDRLVGNQDSGRGDELPLTTSLVTEPMDLRFFDYHRGLAINGVVHFFENVSQVIFDDAVMEAVARDVDHPANRRVRSSGLHIRPFGEGTSQQAAVAAPAVAPPVAAVSVQSVPRTMLNPMARPWSPATDPSPEDQRSMFITFSRGYPLSREEITEFFTTRYGPCVEVVMIERAPARAAPMYGRVVFTSASMIALVLNGQQTAKFMINGKHLWARMYVPRHSVG